MYANRQTLGNKIKIARKAQHLSQMALAEKIDKSPSYINHLENGNRSMGLDTFVQIVTALDQSADWFLGIQTTPLSLRDCSRQDQRLILEMVTALKSALQERDKQ